LVRKRPARRSHNRAKAKTKLARLHRRIADIRADALHKLTTSLMRYRTIVIEDLNVAGMLANRHLARAIADLGFFEFRRQLEYKAALAGSTVIVADRWFASSRLCSACNAKIKRSRLPSVPGRVYRAARSMTAISTRHAI
jgi:putative transposase